MAPASRMYLQNSGTLLYKPTWLQTSSRTVLYTSFNSANGWFVANCELGPIRRTKRRIVNPSKALSSILPFSTCYDESVSLRTTLICTLRIVLLHFEVSHVIHQFSDPRLVEITVARL